MTNAGKMQSNNVNLGVVETATKVAGCFAPVPVSHHSHSSCSHCAGCGKSMNQSDVAGSIIGRCGTTLDFCQSCFSGQCLLNLDVKQ
jgi:hypothetical protein